VICIHRDSKVVLYIWRVAAAPFQHYLVPSLYTIVLPYLLKYHDLKGQVWSIISRCWNTCKVLTFFLFFLLIWMKLCSQFCFIINCANLLVINPIRWKFGLWLTYTPTSLKNHLSNVVLIAMHPLIDHRFKWQLYFHG
jgi:hypothetical protein